MEFAFGVGDRVVYINEQGINFGEKTIVGVEENAVRGPTYYIAPTDTPWFAVSEKCLHRPDSPQIAALTVAVY